MTKENWKKELAELMKEEELPNGDWNMIDGYIPLEDFISTLLALRKKELLEKIEEMKRDYDGKTWQDCKTTEQYVEMTELFSYNQALEDLKKLLA